MKRYPVDKEVFEKNYHNAMMYHRRAKQFLAEEQNVSVVFNVASVAIENYLIALCDLYGVDPGTHNYQCLVDTVAEVGEIKLSTPMAAKIRALDDAYEICSLENYQRKECSEQADALQVLDVCKYLAGLFDQKRCAAVHQDVPGTVM